MPRPPRLDLPGLPQHVVQRGNNRQRCFFDERDYRYYLRCLQDAASRCCCRVHAYVLMTNHVHLLITPDKEHAVGELMQSLGRRYVQHVNLRQRRTGTLWEGRYRSSVVQSEAYLLACYRYIELNPVRAGMVGRPERYRWSSFRAHTEGAPDPLLQDHESYLELGSTPTARRSAYRSLVDEVFDPLDLQRIRSCIHGGRVLGTEPFTRQLERELGRRLRSHSRACCRPTPHPDSDGVRHELASD